MAKLILNAFLLFVLSAGGFCFGAIVVGRVIALRRHPRYLMALGAVVAPAIWVVHALFGTYDALFGTDLLLMMTGVGTMAAGWDAETEMERERDTERVKRLRAAWEQRNAVSAEAAVAQPFDGARTDPQENS